MNVDIDARINTIIADEEQYRGMSEADQLVKAVQIKAFYEVS